MKYGTIRARDVAIMCNVCVATVERWRRNDEDAGRPGGTPDSRGPRWYSHGDKRFIFYNHDEVKAWLSDRRAREAEARKLKREVAQKKKEIAKLLKRPKGR